MRSRNLISLDIEMEQPMSNPQTPDSSIYEPETIQVGFCVISPQGEFLLSGLYNIHKEYQLSDFIKKLTGISDNDLANGVSLAEAYVGLCQTRERYDASRKILTWGQGDQQQIQKELGVSVPWQFGNSSFNVKHLYQFYAEHNGLNSSGGLKKVCDRLGIKFEGRAHNALTDSIMTAKVYLKLCELIFKKENL